MRARFRASASSKSGRVFLRDPAAQDGPLSVGGLRQPMRIAAAAYGPASRAMGRRAARRGFLRCEGGPREAWSRRSARASRPQPHPAFHPGRSARVLVDGAAAGWIGELHPKWQQKYGLPQAPVLFELDAEPLQRLPLPRPGVPSDQPTVVRDISMLFPLETPVQAILDARRGRKTGDCAARSGVLSVFRGAGVPANLKSLAFRVVMQDTERTLTDAEADAARDALVALLGPQICRKSPNIKGNQGSP